ncbi:MAG TPA: hypothetical protein PLF29_03555, partial [bacterium]|nr:hypothetical protein [bacterium]
AGIENILLKTNDELYDYIQYNSCGDSCIVSWTNADGLVETATITLSTLGSSSDAYIFQISQNEVEEINLNGYPEDTSLTLCWDDDFSEYTSVYAELLSGTVGSYTLTPLAYNSINYGGNSNGFDSASSQLGYDSCFDVNSGSDPLSLRIRIFGSDATIAIIPSSSTDLPAQGVLIESVGEVAGTYKKVAVIRKDAFMGPEFSYVLFSTSENSPLSN